jgi:hypothetical protein
MFVTTGSITFPDAIIQIPGWNLFYVLMNSIFNPVDVFRNAIYGLAEQITGQLNVFVMKLLCTMGLLSI